MFQRDFLCLGDETINLVLGVAAFAYFALIN